MIAVLVIIISTFLMLEITRHPTYDTSISLFAALNLNHHDGTHVDPELFLSAWLTACWRFSFTQFSIVGSRNFILTLLVALVRFFLFFFRQPVRSTSNVSVNKDQKRAQAPPARATPARTAPSHATPSIGGSARAVHATATSPTPAPAHSAADLQVFLATVAFHTT